MGSRGPKPVPSAELFTCASQLYWDFLRLAEGYSQTQFDYRHYWKMKEVAYREGFQLSGAEAVEFDRKQESIRASRLTDEEKEKRIRSLELDQEQSTLMRRYEAAQAASMKEGRVPGKPEVLEALLLAETPDRVREISKDAIVRRRERSYIPNPDFDPDRDRPEDAFLPGPFRRVWVSNWPISEGSRLPRCLTLHAEQFIEAKKDPRFPRSNRPTSLKRKLWFLSIALGAAEYGRKTRTAINLLASRTPETVFKGFDSAGLRPKQSKRKAAR